MSKGKAHRDADRWEEDAVDWLAGRRKPGVRDLLGAIHAINPTERKLPAEETARRYALKSRVQSLLIRLFGAELTPREEEPGLVLLTHRPSGMSAGHCRMEELEEDARSWLRFHLDVGEDPESPPPVSNRPTLSRQDAHPSVEEMATARDLIKAGRHALDEYDYDLARTHFENALSRSGGSPQAAVPLLELLVETLAAYPEALDLGSALPESCLQDEDVRALLALAAVRTEDDERAGHYAMGLSCPRIADVFSALAHRALDRGDARGASVALGTFVQQGLVHPDLPLLEKKLAELKRQVLAPLEQELEALAKHGTSAELEAKARAILEEWPDCKAAREVLARIQSQQAAQVAQDRSHKALLVIKQVRSMDVPGQPEAALALLEEAQRLDGSAPGLVDLLRQTKEALEQRKQDAVVTRVAKMLEQEAQAAEGLLTFMELDKALKQRVRERVPRPELGFVEEIAHKCRDAGSKAVVSAALALSQAQQALTAGEDAEAARLLAAHAEMLRQVPAANQMNTTLAEREARRRRATAEALIQQAEAECERGEMERALETLKEVDVPDDALAARAQQLQERVERQLRITELQASYQAQQDGEDALTAREAARELARLMEQPEERERWSAAAQQQDARLTKLWRMRVARIPEGGVEHGITHLNWENLSSLKPAVRLSADGRSLVERRAFGGWMFLYTVDLVTCRVSSATWMRMPIEEYACAHLELRADHVQLSVHDGRMLFLSPDPWRIAGKDDLLPWSKESGWNAVIPIPGTSLIWIGEFKSLKYRFAVVDRKRNKTLRTVAHGGHPSLLSTRKGYRVLAPPAHQQKPGVYHPDGDTEPIRIPQDMEVDSVLEHPTQDGWVLVGKLSSSQVGRRWTLVETGRTFTQPVFHTLVDAEEFSCNVAAVPPHRCIHVFIKSGTEFKCYTVGPDIPPGDVKPRIMARQPTVLMNHDASTVVTPVIRAGTLSFLPLGRDLSQLPESDPPPWEHLRPNLTGPFFMCRDGSLLEHELREELRQQYEPLGTQQEKAQWLQQAFEKHKGVASELVAVCSQPNWFIEKHLCADILKQAVSQHPEHPTLLMMHCAHLIDQKDYLTGLRCINRIQPSNLPGDQLQHLLHLLGIVNIRLGAVGPADEYWRAGTRSGDGNHCGLESCLALTHAIMKEPESKDLELDAPTVVQFWATLMRADEFILKGDHPKTLHVLDRPVVHDSNEVQAMARLVWAHLHVPARDDVARMSKALALARLCSIFPPDGMTIAWDVPLGKREWTQERLQEMVTRAREWLEGDQDGYPV